MTRGRSPAYQGQDQDDDDLFAYFNKSVAIVQAHADQFEKTYARPALETTQAFFDERPITATFLVIFTVLSFLPVISFIGFALFSVASFTLVALSCAFLASLVVVLAFLSVLVISILITFVSSTFLTLLGLSVYSLTRLIVLTQEHGRAGIFLWINETKDALLHTLPAPAPYPPRIEITELSEYRDAMPRLDGHGTKHEETEDETVFANSSRREESSPEDVRHPLDCPTSD